MRIAHTPREGLRVLHSSTLADVMRDIPAIATARNRFETYRSEVAASPDYYGESIEDAEARVQEAIASAIDAGKPIPPDVFAPIAQAQARIVGASAINGSAQNIDTQFATELERAIADNRNKVYELLHQRLTKTVQAGRAAYQDLGGTLSAEAAIARDRGGAWKTYTSVRREFVSLREAQRTMYRYADEIDHDDKINRVATALANPLEVFHDIGAALWGVSQQTDNGNFEAIEAPWPDPWADAGAHFDWLTANPDAQPWVPTSAQTAEVWQELDAATQANSSGPRRRLRDRVPVASTTHVAAIGQDGKVRTAWKTQPADANARGGAA